MGKCSNGKYSTPHHCLFMCAIYGVEYKAAVPGLHIAEPTHEAAWVLNPLAAGSHQFPHLFYHSKTLLDSCSISWNKVPSGLHTFLFLTVPRGQKHFLAPAVKESNREWWEFKKNQNQCSLTIWSGDSGLFLSRQFQLFKTSQVMWFITSRIFQNTKKTQ